MGSGLTSRRRGFSLLELMICVGILTTGIIFIVDVFTQMLNASTKGGDWTAATYLASSRIEQLVYNPGQLITDVNSTGSNSLLTGPTLVFNPGAFEPVQIASVNKTTYYVTYSLYDVTNSTNTAAGSDLYYLDTKIDWFGLPPSGSTPNTKSGYGRLSTHLSRLIYVH